MFLADARRTRWMRAQGSDPEQEGRLRRISRMHARAVFATTIIPGLQARIGLQALE